MLSSRTPLRSEPEAPASARIEASTGPTHGVQQKANATPAAAQHARPANAEHRQPKEHDQRARDPVQPGALADQERSNDRCACAESDEDAEETGEEERARGRHLAVDPLPALAQLLEADAADRGDVAGNQRENAWRNEGDCAGGEDERQTESGDVYGSSPLRGLPRRADLRRLLYGRRWRIAATRTA